MKHDQCLGNRIDAATSKEVKEETKRGKTKVLRYGKGSRIKFDRINNNSEKVLPKRARLKSGGEIFNLFDNRNKFNRQFRVMKRKKLYHPKKYYVRIQIPRKGYFYRSYVHLKGPGSSSFLPPRLESSLVPKSEQKIQIPGLAAASSQISGIREKGLIIKLPKKKLPNRSQGSRKESKFNVNNCVNNNNSPEGKFGRKKETAGTVSEIDFFSSAAAAAAEEAEAAGAVTEVAAAEAAYKFNPFSRERFLDGFDNSSGNNELMISLQLAGKKKDEIFSDRTDRDFPTEREDRIVLTKSGISKERIKGKIDFESVAPRRGGSSRMLSTQENSYSALANAKIGRNPPGNRIGESIARSPARSDRREIEIGRKSIARLKKSGRNERKKKIISPLEPEAKIESDLLGSSDQIGEEMEKSISDSEFPIDRNPVARDRIEKSISDFYELEKKADETWIFTDRIASRYPADERNRCNFANIFMGDIDLHLELENYLKKNLEGKEGVVCTKEKSHGEEEEAEAEDSRDEDGDFGPCDPSWNDGKLRSRDEVNSAKNFGNRSQGESISSYKTASSNSFGSAPNSEGKSIHENDSRSAKITCFCSSSSSATELAGVRRIQLAGEKARRSQSESDCENLERKGSFESYIRRTFGKTSFQSSFSKFDSLTEDPSLPISQEILSRLDPRGEQEGDDDYEKIIPFPAKKREKNFRFSRRSGILYKNLDYCLSSESVRPCMRMTGSDFGGFDRWEEVIVGKPAACRGSDQLDKLLDGSRDLPMSKINRKSMKNRSSLEELIEMYESILKVKKINCKDDEEATEKAENQFLNSLLSFMNNLMKSKTIKSNSIRFPEIIDSISSRPVPKWTAGMVNENFNSLEEYVKLVREMLASPLSIDQISRLNEIAASHRRRNDYLKNHSITMENKKIIESVLDDPKKAEENRKETIQVKTEAKKKEKKSAVVNVQVKKDAAVAAPTAIKKNRKPEEGRKRKMKKKSEEFSFERNEIETGGNLREMKSFELSSLNVLDALLKTEFCSSRFSWKWDGTSMPGIPEFRSKLLINVKLSGEKIIVNEVSHIKSEHFHRGLPGNLFHRQTTSGSSDLIIESLNGEKIEKGAASISSRETTIGKTSLCGRGKPRRKAIRSPEKNPPKRNRKIKREDGDRKEAIVERVFKKETFTGLLGSFRGRRDSFEYDQHRLKVQHPIEAIVERSESKIDNLTNKIPEREEPEEPGDNDEREEKGLGKALITKDLLEGDLWTENLAENLLDRGKSNGDFSPSEIRPSAEQESIGNILFEEIESTGSQFLPSRPFDTVCYSFLQKVSGKKLNKGKKEFGQTKKVGSDSRGTNSPFRKKDPREKPRIPNPEVSSMKENSPEKAKPGEPSSETDRKPETISSSSPGPPSHPPLLLQSSNTRVILENRENFEFLYSGEVSENLSSSTLDKSSDFAEVSAKSVPVSSGNGFAQVKDASSEPVAETRGPSDDVEEEKILAVHSMCDAQRQFSDLSGRIHRKILPAENSENLPFFIHRPQREDNVDLSFPSLMIQSDSILKSRSSFALTRSKVKALFRSGAEVEFVPGRVTEGSAEELPFVTFVLTPRQKAVSGIPSKQIKIVRPTPPRAEQEEEEENGNENVANHQNPLESIEKFIETLSRSKIENEKPEKKRKPPISPRNKETVKIQPKSLVRPKPKMVSEKKSNFVPCRRLLALRSSDRKAYHECQKRKSLAEEKQAKKSAGETEAKSQRKSKPEKDGMKAIPEGETEKVENVENEIPLDRPDEPIALNEEKIVEDSAETAAAAEAAAEAETAADSTKKDSCSSTTDLDPALQKLISDMLSMMSVLKKEKNSIGGEEVSETIDQISTGDTDSVEAKPEITKAEIAEEPEATPESAGSSQEVPQKPEPILEEANIEGLSAPEKRLKTYKVRIHCDRKKLLSAELVNTEEDTQQGESETDSPKEQPSKENSPKERLSKEPPPKEPSPITEEIKLIDSLVSREETSDSSELTRTPSTYFDAEEGEIRTEEEERTVQVKARPLRVTIKVSPARNPEGQTESWERPRRKPVSLSPSDAVLLSGNRMTADEEGKLFERIVDNLQENNAGYALTLLESFFEKSEKVEGRSHSEKIQFVLESIKVKNLMATMEKSGWLEFLSLLDEIIGLFLASSNEEAILSEKIHRAKLLEPKMAESLEYLENEVYKARRLMSAIQMENDKSHPNESRKPDEDWGPIEKPETSQTDLRKVFSKIGESFRFFSEAILPSISRLGTALGRNNPEGEEEEAEGCGNESIPPAEINSGYEIHETKNTMRLTESFSSPEESSGDKEGLRSLRNQVRQKRMRVRYLMNFKCDSTVLPEVEAVKSLVAEKIQLLEKTLSDLEGKTGNGKWTPAICNISFFNKSLNRNSSLLDLARNLWSKSSAASSGSSSSSAAEDSTGNPKGNGNEKRKQLPCPVRPAFVSSLMKIWDRGGDTVDSVLRN